MAIWSQARRNVFQSGAAERSEESERSERCERSEPRAKRVLTAGGLGGAVSPPGGVRGDSPGIFLKKPSNLEQFGGI